MPTPPRILDYVRDGDVAAVQAWVATGTRQDARVLFWDLLIIRRVDRRFISLLLDTGFFTFTKAEHKAVLQAIGQAAITDTPRKVRLAAEAILGAPEGSLKAKKVLIKELCQKVLSRTVRERITKEQAVVIEAAELDGFDGVQIEAKYLVRAAGLSNASVVRELCSRGADPNHISEHNWTALHVAAQAHHEVDIVVALLDCGGDPNLRVAPEGAFDERLNPPTPLMCAAASSHSAEMVRVLLSRGADFSATNATGGDAEAYARAALDRPTRDVFPDFEDRNAWDEDWRLVGEAERILELFADVRTAGSWKRYVGAWRVQLLLLQKLCSSGRASPVTALGPGHARLTPSIEDLEATSGCKVTRPRKRAPPTDATEEGPTDALMARLVALPPPLVGKVASYWRTARDPRY